MKCDWKRMAVVCALALLAAPLLAADTLPRAEWHAKVGACAQDAQALKETIGQLSAEDQVAFLAEVNEAIAALPGSDEAKAARFYAANKAAVTGASKANLPAVLAEVYATVPPEYLTEINERFAAELFNREASSVRPLSDDQYTQLSTNVMATIIARCQKAENASVRETFAILMFVRAAGGEPSADLIQTLVSQLPDAAAREQAANEWINPALGVGQDKTYDPLLGVAQAGEEPNHAIVAELAGASQIAEALLGDLHAAVDTPVSASRIGGGAFGSAGVAGAAVIDQDDMGLNRIPRAYVSSKEAVGGTADGPNTGDNPYYTHKRDSEPGSSGGGREPGGYLGQGI